jgi:hypothetical protein
MFSWPSDVEYVACNPKQTNMSPTNPRLVMFKSNPRACLATYCLPMRKKSGVIHTYLVHRLTANDPAPVEVSIRVESDSEVCDLHEVLRRRAAASSIQKYWRRYQRKKEWQRIIELYTHLAYRPGGVYAGRAAKRFYAAAAAISHKIHNE